MTAHPDLTLPGYDFSRCKLCGHSSATPVCHLETNRLYVCGDCDFHFLDRLDPPANDVPVTLTSQQQHYIDKRLTGNLRILQSRLLLVREFENLRDRLCLDIGTGVGQFLTLLSEAGARAEGIEPSGLRREYAREKFGLSLNHRPVEDPAWRRRSDGFDVITLWDVLEHVNDPVRTVQAAADLLKPGGLLFVETDNRDSSHYRLSRLLCRLTRGRISLFLPQIYRPVPYGHKQIFRPKQLYALAGRCGFELIAATPGNKNFPDTQKTGYRPRGQIVLVARKPDRV